MICGSLQMGLNGGLRMFLILINSYLPPNKLCVLVACRVRFHKPVSGCSEADCVKFGSKVIVKPRIACALCGYIKDVAGNT